MLSGVFTKSMTKIGAIWLLVGITIGLRTFFSTTGMASGDGVYYLEAAQNLLLDQKFRITTLGIGQTLPTDGYDPFTLWPIGYPTLIAVCAFLTGLPVFWASKLLGWILAGFSLWGFWRLAPDEFPTLSGTLLFATPLLLFSSTMSEPAFLTTLIWFVYWIHQFIQTQHKKALIWMLVCAVLLFLFRYVGIFAGLVLLQVLWKLRHERPKNFRSLWAVVFIWSGLVLGYAIWNHARSGAFSGMDRFTGTPPETTQVLLSWLKGFGVVFLPLVTDRIQGAMFLFLVGLQVIIVGFSFRSPSLNQPHHAAPSPIRNEASLVHLLFSTGLLYLVVMTVARWNHVLWLQQYSFYMELFAPVFWLWIPAIVLKARSHPKWYGRVKKAFWATAITSFLFYVPLWAIKQVYENKTSYPIAAKWALNSAKDLPKGSVVLFGDAHLNYLRPDLIRIEPPSKPLFARPAGYDATLEHLGKAYPNRPLYIFMNTRFNNMNPDDFVTSQWFDSSFVDRNKKAAPNTKLRLR